MARPRKGRCVWGEPEIVYFKPRGIPVDQLEEVILAVEELEAVRLKDMEGFEQGEAARNMKVSRPTFHRVLKSAREKIAEALVNGKALKIEGGVYVMAAKRFTCSECGHTWEVSFGAPRPDECPQCKSTNVHRNEDDQGARRRGPHGSRCVRGLK